MQPNLVDDTRFHIYCIYILCVCVFIDLYVVCTLYLYLYIVSLLFAL